MGPENDTNAQRGGFHSFLITVLVLFVVVLAVLTLLAWFGGDGGLLEFNYEGA